MLNKEITLTCFDLIFTYGFWKLISFIWIPIILIAVIIFLLYRELA